MNSLSSFPYTTNLLLGEDARKACMVEIQDLAHFLICRPVVRGGLHFSEQSKCLQPALK